MEHKVIDAFEVKALPKQKTYKVVSLFSGLGEWIWGLEVVFSS